MSILLELIFEIVLQVVLEILAELGVHFFRNFVGNVRWSALASVSGYSLLGILLGLLSILVIPYSLVRFEGFHGISLLVAPFAGGTAMSLVGMLRRRHGDELIRLDTFVYGALFAFMYALVRWWVLAL